jgi:hypothetical protein
MTTQPTAGPSDTTQPRRQTTKTRIQRIALIVVPLLFLFILFAQWMDARERRAQLQELQTRIDHLQVEINKARTRVDQTGGANRSGTSP